MVRTAIINAVKQFFDSQNWKYDFFEEEGMFQTAVGLTEESGVMIHAIVGESTLTVMTAAELNAPEKLYPEITAFVNDVNTRLLLGGLVFESEEGILYFRLGQNCVNQAPNAQIVEDAFMYPISFMDENLDTFAQLFAGKISAQAALERMFAAE